MNGKVYFIVGKTKSPKGERMPEKAGDRAVYERLRKLGYQVQVFDLRSFLNEEDKIQKSVEPPIEKLFKYGKGKAKEGTENYTDLSLEEKMEIQKSVLQERMYGLLGEIEIVVLSSTILDAVPKAKPSATGTENISVENAPQSETTEPGAPVSKPEKPSLPSLSKEEIKELVRQQFRNRLVSVVVLDARLLVPLGMASQDDIVKLPDNCQNIEIARREHDRVGGLSGIHTITEASIPYAVKNLPRTAVIIASATQKPADESAGNDSDEAEDDDNGDVGTQKDLQAFFYGYSSGKAMKDGKSAPARRIALLFPATAAAKATDTGWEIFYRMIDLAGKAATINDVFQAEWVEIRERRKYHDVADACRKYPKDANKRREYFQNTDIDPNYPPENLVGLALSGGGIRSATFSLGLLQGFKEKGILKFFDYMSTVSGGGYMGGWWSAWLARDKNSGIFPKDEKIEAKRVSDYLKSKDKLNEGSLSAHTDPIHHLRLFSNYLTPRKGLLSSDTWDAITMLVRNMFLTWVVLLPILFAFVMVGQFYFVLQKDSPYEFLTPFQKQIIEVRQKAERKTANFLKVYEESKQQESINRDSDLQQVRLQFIDNDSERRKAEIDVIKDQDTKLVALKKRTDEKIKAWNDHVNVVQAQYSAVLAKRFRISLYLLMPMAALFVVITVFWMRAAVTPDPIVKLAHTVPGLIFWLLVSCVVYLIVSANSTSATFSRQTLMLPFKLLYWWNYPLAFILCFGIAASLWWRSLPFKNKEKWENVWKINRRGNILSFLLIFLMVSFTLALMTVLKFSLINTENEYIFWLLLLVAVVSISIWIASQPKNEDKWEWRKRIQGNRLVSMQSRLMVMFVGIALILVLSGYGYEIANYLLRDPMSQKNVADYVAKAGGWITLVLSIVGSIFTAVKSSPSGGEDTSNDGAAGFKTRLMFAVTPVLVLVCLAVAFAWLARWLLIQFQVHPEFFITTINKALIISVALYLFLAVYEIRNWDNVFNIVGRVVTVIGIGGAIYFLTICYTPPEQVIKAGAPYSFFLFLLAGLVAAAGAFLIILRLLRNHKKKWHWSILSALLVIGLFIVLSGLAKGNASEISREQSVAILTGIICCAVIMVFEITKSDGQTNRTLSLVSFTYLVLLCFLFFTFFVNYKKHDNITMAYLALGLLFLAVSWSVAIGWMTDPNLLSLHTFYKVRLIRAYMGASNPDRNTQEISEAARGDDVLLRELQNCQRGAPYHLINTTLNLVGGKDLSTAQRSSDYFTFSKLYSGSSRTGYRRNMPEQYMQGQMSLGTAVAISGAAVSPNMGAKTQTSAVAMLLTLLNVRLGYWASTPNRNLWRSAQAALWPFYMLKEFSSQTNDVSGYCYLTDGGHFDNTGLYSLVERGCRFIILADNGADTKPCFEDLGDAIRRCRIDFKAEITLDVAPFFKEADKASGDKLTKSHYIVGTIRYSQEHLRYIGWTKDDAENLEKQLGVLIVVKPSLIKDDSADLRQYARQNEGFPQQSTGDLWYDEAQFESYRQIGKLCAEKVLDELGLADMLNNDKNKALTPHKVECAFQLARKMYEAGIEEWQKEPAKSRQSKLEEQFNQCMKPQADGEAVIEPSPMD